MKIQLKVATAATLTCGLLAAAAAAATAPPVSTAPARHVGTTSATLRGTAQPRGIPTAYLFQFGLTSHYGTSTHGRFLHQLTGTATVASRITGLIPGTVYHYRAVGIQKGVLYPGADATFTTAGSAPVGGTTGPAIFAKPDRAGVSGVVNPAGARTTWYFRYGLSAAYGQQTVSRALGPKSPTTTVVRLLTGLLPARVYHYQLVAVTGTTTHAGRDETFFTAPKHPSRPHIVVHINPTVATVSPFTFTISGRIRRPASVPALYACRGAIEITVTRDGRVLRLTRTAVTPKCRFKTHVAFLAIPGPRPRGVRFATAVVSVQYVGTPDVGPSRVKHGTITIG